MLAGAALFNYVVEHELSVALGGALAFCLGLSLVKRVETSTHLGLQPPRLRDIN